MKRTRRPPLREQVRFAHTIATPNGAEVVWHAHECEEANFTVGAFCEACELGLEPSTRQPAEPHGWVSCSMCNTMVIACPLGVAEGEGLGADERKDTPVLVGAAS